MTTRVLAGLFAAAFFALLSAEARADCYPGDSPCGTGCMPSGAACCASLGYDGYCDPGESCTSDGKCSSGSSGGTCPPGYPVDCGDGCCPSGTTCTATGCESSGGGGGTCPPGYPIDCGDGCCPSGTTCAPNNKCKDNGGGTSPGGPSGSSTGGDYCSENYSQGNCSTVRSCVDANSERAWYTADGNTFQCSSAYNCNDAAWDLAEYCTNSGGGYDSDDESRSGCSVARPFAPSSSGGGPLALVTVAAGLALSLQLRRRNRR